MAEEALDECCERIAEIFRALGHPLRLKIVRELAESPRNVNWLHEKLGGSQANISKHLAVLRDHSIVSRNRQGVENIYELVSEETLELCGCAFNCIRSQIKNEVDLMDKFEGAKQIFDNKG